MHNKKDHNIICSKYYGQSYKLLLLNKTHTHTHTHRIVLDPAASSLFWDHDHHPPPIVTGVLWCRRHHHHLCSPFKRRSNQFFIALRPHPLPSIIAFNSVATTIKTSPPFLYHMRTAIRRSLCLQPKVPSLSHTQKPSKLSANLGGGCGVRWLSGSELAIFLYSFHFLVTPNHTQQ